MPPSVNGDAVLPQPKEYLVAPNPVDRYSVGDADLGLRMKLQNQGLKPVKERLLARRDLIDVLLGGWIHRSILT